MEDRMHSPPPQATPTPDPRGPSDASRRWLTYRQAAAYCGWSVAYLRNLVSVGKVPVYGKPRVRRFRRDMLDLFLTDPERAMRSFLAERDAQGR
jgi:hypothetical protein